METSSIWDTVRLNASNRRLELVANYYQMHHKRRRYDFVMNEDLKVDFFVKQLSEFDSGISPDNRLALDIGCRGGALTDQLKPWAKWVGVDVDPSALEEARKRGLDCQQMDIAVDLDFKDNSFDLVVMTEVLEHLPYPLITLTEIHRILKPGKSSMFLGSVPIDYHLRRRLAVLAGRRLEGDPTHIHSFSYQELKELLEHYFESVEFFEVRTPHKPWNMLPESLSVIDIFWAATKPREGVKMAEITLRH